MKRSKDNNVNTIIITGTSMKASKQGISFVRKHSKNSQSVQLFSTVGIHPHDAKTFTLVNED